MFVGEENKTTLKTVILKLIYGLVSITALFSPLIVVVSLVEDPKAFGVVLIVYLGVALLFGVGFIHDKLMEMDYKNNPHKYEDPFY